MTDRITIGPATLYLGDNLAVMATLPDNSVDAVVTDPPAGISMMCKDWDHDKGGRTQWIAWMTQVAAECRRILKPGGHALVWAIPRTAHWTATAWEDAGFEVRDRIAHCFGSGFPKSARVNRDPMFCQCDETACSASSTSREQQQQVRTGTGLDASCDDPLCEDDLHLTRTVEDFLDGCHPGCGSYGEPAQKVQGFFPEQTPLPGYAQEHIRFSEPLGVQDSLSLHNLSPARCSDHLSSQGYSLHDSCEKARQHGTLSSIKLHHKISSDSELQASHKSSNDESLLAFSGSTPNQERHSLPLCKACGKPDANGFGSALKPAIEDWWLLRKPLDGTIAGNVLAHGTGALNIDGCRVGTETRTNASKPRADRNGFVDGFVDGTQSQHHDYGRFPANFIHDGSPEVVECFPVSNQKPAAPSTFRRTQDTTGWSGGSKAAEVAGLDRGDSGSAARYFKTCPDIDPEDFVARRLVYGAKANNRDRSEGCEGLDVKSCGMMEDDNYAIKTGAGNLRDTKRSNFHPCVKSTSLMTYLCRLVTPPGGTILDPFAGSGSTGKAALLENFGFIGIEQDPEYLAICAARIRHAHEQPRQLTLDAA